MKTHQEILARYNELIQELHENIESQKDYLYSKLCKDLGIGVGSEVHYAGGAKSARFERFLFDDPTFDEPEVKITKVLVRIPPHSKPLVLPLNSVMF